VRKNRFLIEAKAELFVLSGKYREGLECYLSLDVLKTSSSVDGGREGSIDGGGSRIGADYRHVFQLIEKETLFNDVQQKITNMMLLSKKLTGQLLIRNIDNFPIPLVINQIQRDRGALHWYLHLLFTKAFDQYNLPSFAIYHNTQVTLYIEFFDHKVNDGESKEEEKKSGAIHKKTKSHLEYTSPLLDFISKSSYVDHSSALEFCKASDPPLYREVAYILQREGRVEEALGVYLTDIGDVELVYEFVRDQKNSLTEEEAEEMWKRVIDHSTNHPDFLIQMLDFLGHCRVDALDLVRQLPPDMLIPSLPSKIDLILGNAGEKKWVYGTCREVFEQDTLNLSRQLNQRRRKGARKGRKNRVIN